MTQVLTKLFIDFKEIFSNGMNLSHIDFSERRMIINMDDEFVSECS